MVKRSTRLGSSTFQHLGTFLLIVFQCWNCGRVGTTAVLRSFSSGRVTRKSELLESLPWPINSSQVLGFEMPV